jgi:hypothetical protein
MFLGEGCEQAARRFRFDFAAERCAACFQSNRVCRIPLRRRPLDKMSKSVHHGANLGRKSQADKYENRLSKHIGFHRGLLPINHSHVHILLEAASAPSTKSGASSKATHSQR